MIYTGDAKSVKNMYTKSQLNISVAVVFSTLLLLLIIGFALSAMINLPSKHYSINLERPSEYMEVLAVITAYTASPAETDNDPFINASGERVREGTVACPGFLEFGTKIRVDGKDYNGVLGWVDELRKEI